MSKEPVSHHYLPQFYLKSFAFEFSKKKKLYRVYSYDKEFQRVVISKQLRRYVAKSTEILWICLVKKTFLLKSLFQS